LQILAVEQRPVYKYAKAFGLPYDKLRDSVSNFTNGVLSYLFGAKNASCTNIGGTCTFGANSEFAGKCSATPDPGKYGPGACIPPFSGSCHLWSSAAILEEEPRCGVKYNGVYFSIADLKVLMVRIL
jgi:hypothetical protein